MAILFLVTVCDYPTEAPDDADIGTATAELGLAERPPEVIADRYIVRFHDRSGDLSSRANQVLENTDARVGTVYRHVLGGFSATIPPEAVRAVENHPAVSRVIPDVRFSFLPSGRSSALPLSASPAESWGQARINQREYDDNVFDPPNGGSGVEVWVLDSGIRWDHSEFTAFRVDTTKRYDGFREPSDEWYGAGCWEQGDPPDGGGGEPGDTIWSNYDGPHGDHGTAVASIAGGNTLGIAPSTTVYTVRVWDCHGQTTLTRVIAGFDFVAAESSSPAVANFSGSVPVAWADTLHGWSDFEDAVSDLAALVPVVVGAANDDADADDYSPARMSEVITVGGSTDADERVSDSNWGSSVDLFAPGDDLTAAGVSSTSAEISFGGTSGAAPHVAGVVALFLENHSISASQVADSILARATQGELSTSGLGSGSPNLLAFTPRILGSDIVGPDTAQAGQNQWDSNPTGGDWTYDYHWERKWDVSPSWETVGTSEVVQMNLSESHGDFSLRLTLDSDIQQHVDTVQVIGPCHESGTGCPTFLVAPTPPTPLERERR